MKVVHIFKGKGRHPWYVRLVSRNGQVLAVSEGYYSRWNAKRAARKMYPEYEIRFV